jgi:hypothetical protein
VVSAGFLVLYALLAALVGGFVAFYLYSRTPAWRSSETRMATMRLMVIIGPMFGMHFKKPPPDRPAVMTPGPDPEEKDPRDLRVS